jgi:hypothetical protein
MVLAVAGSRWLRFDCIAMSFRTRTKQHENLNVLFSNFILYKDKTHQKKEVITNLILIEQVFFIVHENHE